MAGNKSIFNRLEDVLGINSGEKRVNQYSFNSKDIIVKTNNEEEYKKQKLENLQQDFLRKQWIKTGIESAYRGADGVNYIKSMYQDADLMDQYPEIASALNTFMDEVCTLSNSGRVLNIYSNSERIKNILEDLFINKLQINVTLPLIVRTLCKYGNDYHLLNIDKDKGVIGWQQLPVYDMVRSDSGISGMNYKPSKNSKGKSDGVTFSWAGNGEINSFKSWQMCHFRLLTDSQYLPYGVSILNKSRRHWRMLSMMEDMMLIYRLERSVERRIFYINVGNIGTEDVKSYIETVANSFKRQQIIDPQTGQVDLRRGIIGVDQDFFIPTYGQGDSTKVETLQGAQNMTAIDDINFMQMKVLTGMETPKEFIMFDKSSGDGKNLSMLDIRYSRKVNRIQQFVLMELNKIAIIHLYLNKLDDDVQNFTLTMNNPSNQVDMMRIEQLQSKITLIRDAVSDPGNGIPIMSLKRALKEILNYTDAEILQNFQEIRLETAVAAELENTTAIIKRTGIFDATDKSYGEPGASYDQAQGGNGEDNGDAGGPAPSLGGGGGMGMSDFGMDDGGDVEGNEEDMEFGDAAEMEGDNAPEEVSTPMEGKKNDKPLIIENTFWKKYEKYLRSEMLKNGETSYEFKMPKIITEDMKNIGKE